MRCVSAIGFLREPKDIDSFLQNLGYTPIDHKDLSYREYKSKNILIEYYTLEDTITIENLWSVIGIFSNKKKKAKNLAEKLAKNYKAILYKDHNNPFL